MCWPQCSSTGSFCGLRYNPIRIQRLFLPTFSDKPDGTKLQTSEAFAIWRGRATERTRPAACGGARNVEFVRTNARGATVAVSPQIRHSGANRTKGPMPTSAPTKYPKLNLGGLYPQGVCRINGSRAFGSETAKYQWTMLCRCAIIFAKINHKHSLIQRYRKEDQYGGNQGKLRR